MDCLLPSQPSLYFFLRRFDLGLPLPVSSASSRPPLLPSKPASSPPSFKTRLLPSQPSLSLFLSLCRLCSSLPLSMLLHPSSPSPVAPHRMRPCVHACTQVALARTPLVDLPLGATEDRVCGTIDFERALTEGECWAQISRSGGGSTGERKLESGRSGSRGTIDFARALTEGEYRSWRRERCLGK